ncbi:MAG: response regulator, partial [Acidobacteriota bacterium]
MTETVDPSGPKDLLLVESNEADASLLQQWVSETPDLGRGVLRVSTMAEAFEAIEKSDFDAVLLSLEVSDAHGLATLEEMRRRSADVPLVVLGTSENGVAGTEAVAAGADDFVSKESWSRAPVAQSIRFAMLRRLPAAFKAPTLRDGLTGLHNLSAFGVIGEHTMHTARRLGTSVAVAVVSPLGPEGQQLDRVELTHALQASGRRLRGSCRQSDVVSRVSADQIAVL